MAESVARVKILAQVEGLEGFDKLKGAFKGLQQAIGPTDQQLAKARQDIIAFGEAGKKTEQVIRGQIDALRALKTQAGTGGQLYTTLGADIRRLEGDVRDLNAAYTNLATGASYTAKQLATLTPATKQPGMLDAQIRGMRESLEQFKLLSKEYIQGIADINKASQQGARNQQNNNLFSNALNANPYLQQNTFFFDAAKQFEKQAAGGGLPATVAAKQQEISRIKEQLQNVLRDASSLDPLLNDIRRIENNLASSRGPAVTGGGTRSTIPGLEGVGREMSPDWQKARITLGQLTSEYERLKQAQQDQVHVLKNQLIDAEDELQRMLNGTTKEQEQATRAAERRARVEEKLANIQDSATRAPNVGGYRDPGTGAMLARGNESTRQARANLAAQVAMPPREISALYQSIGNIGLSKVSAQIERMGNDYSKVATHIKFATQASDGSIHSLQAQRQAWDALRNTVAMNSHEFKLATAELNKLDKKLERSQIGGLRGKIGYIGQGVGAIASAGIFGGPEGAIGGALGGGIGALAGGPAGFAAGSFIGSSIGAYAGILRQNITATGEFAAEVKRLEIALKGVTGSSEEFAQAQRVIRLAGVELNVPVLEATKGFTQLTAAIKGSGGSVGDAEIVFRGVTEAIKATGGGAEEVEASLTAMAQIFSKGKVSAEELQGQLGERLPGAVTLFAQATGRTLPQLQKDLEQGVVGLNDVMKFAASLSDKYGDQAYKIASSTEDSTARMKVALDDLRLAFGSIVKPITASIQTIIARLAEMATRALRAVGLVKDGMAELGAAGRGKDLQTRAADARRLLGDSNQSVSEKRAAFKAASDLANAATPQKSLAGVQQNVRTLQQARDIVRQISADGLSKTQIDLLQDYGAKLDQRIKSEQTLLDTLKKQRKVTEFTNPGEAKGDLDRKALDKLAREQQQLDESLAKAEIQLNDAVFQHQIELIKKRYDYEEERIRLQRDVWAGTFEGIQGESARAANAFVNRLDDLRKRVRLAALDAMQAQQQVASARQMETVASQGLGGAPSGGGGRVIEYLTGDKSSTAYRADHGGSNYHEHLAFETAKQMRAAMEALKAAGIKIGSTTGGRHAKGSYHYKGLAFDVPASQVPVGQEQALSRKVREVLAASGFSGAGIGRNGLGAQVRRDVRAEGQVGIAMANAAQAGRFAEMEKNQVSGLMGDEAKRYAQERTQSLRDEAKAMEDGNVIVRERMKLEAEGLRPELLEARLKVLQIEQQRADKIEQINRNIAQYQNDPEALAGFRAELEDTNSAYDRQIEAVNSLAQAQTAAGAALSGRIGQLRSELQELTNFENILINISQVMETEISGAISTAVSGLITGSHTIKQTLSQMFANIGQAFLKMAADIIAKQVVMITLQTILKALGAISGGGASAADGTTYTQGTSISSFAKFEKGGVMTSRGPVPLRKYSSGGIADSPQLALFGEGSKPEAYVPLPDGRRIPVAMQEPANSNGRMRDLMGSSPTQAPASPVLNMSFETTSIGGVEYVSRDQLESAMAETRRAAARDGAKRGMSMTLDKLQQSPSTRSRVGLR